MIQGYALLYMFFQHVYFISKGMTMIEWACCRGKNFGCNFDRGLTCNWRLVMGKYSLLWFLPVQFGPPNDAVLSFIPVKGELDTVVETQQLLSASPTVSSQLAEEII